MTPPKILLLTGTPPGSPGVGGIFLHDLCVAYPKDRICCYAIAPSWNTSVSSDLNWLPISFGHLPRQHGFNRCGLRISHLTGFFWRYYVRKFDETYLLNSIVAFGKQQNVTMIWATLDEPIIINIVRKATQLLNAELVLTIWDPPEQISSNYRFDRYFQKRVLSEFGQVLKLSLRCGVASEPMAKEYGMRYKVEPIVLIHGVERNIQKPPADRLVEDNRFIIGFAGSLYARKEWNALLSALSNLKWQIDGRNVSIIVLGNCKSSKIEKEMPIQFLGWQPLQKTVDILSRVDINYLPYWFDVAHSHSVRMCFPNKLSTYLASGRPVFFHGPRDSSPAQFFEKFPIGLCCHSMKEAEIIDCLRQFMVDKDLYGSFTKAGQRALDAELNMDVFRSRFADLIGIEKKELSI